MCQKVHLVQLSIHMSTASRRQPKNVWRWIQLPMLLVMLHPRGWTVLVLFSRDDVELVKGVTCQWLQKPFHTSVQMWIWRRRLHSQTHCLLTPYTKWGPYLPQTCTYTSVLAFFLSLTNTCTHTMIHILTCNSLSLIPLDNLLLHNSSQYSIL